MTGRRGFLRRAGMALFAAPLLPVLRAAGSAAADAGVVLVERYAMTMGAIAGIRLYGRDRAFCDEAIEKAFAEMRRIDRLMSAFDPASALSGINRAAGRAGTAVPAEMIAVLESARQFHAATGGAFDVTVGPLMDLYGFHGPSDPGRGEDRPLPCPDDRRIAAALDAVGFGNVMTDPARGTVALSHRLSRLDPGGIGVGHALDCAAASLRAAGVESALINHSGDILAIGAPPGSGGWEIGIQDPADPRGTIAAFSLRDRSVSTSGNYENFIETRCGRTGHILDPATGRPPSRFLSVSVMAGTSLAADALSTGFFTGGVKLSAPVPPGTGPVSAFIVSPGGGSAGGAGITTEHIARVAQDLPRR